MRVGRPLGALVACLLPLVAAAPARGADPRDPEGLFDEGRKLMENPATLDAACKTLAESYRLAPRGDTLLNLAECHRRQGKTATARREFDQAIRLGAEVGYSDAMKVAKKLRDELAAKVSTLTVSIPAETAALEGLGIEVNGKPWPRDDWNAAVPHDPGPVEVAAVAKGRKRFSQRVELGTEKDEKTVQVVFEAVPAPPPPPPLPAPRPEPPKVVESPGPVWPWVVGGLGLGMLGASVGFGIEVTAAGGDLDDACGSDRKACPPGYDFESARGREMRSFGMFVGFGAGGLLAVSAGALGLGLTRRTQSGTQTGLLVSPDGLGVRGSFR